MTASATTEYWGTFSVRDHLARRPFVADVLLYDRLLIPTLPEGEPEESWPAAWDLKRQRQLIDQLGDFAIPLPWTAAMREEWGKLYEAEKAQPGAARTRLASNAACDAVDARTLPYDATRRVLTEHANKAADDALLKRLRATRGAKPGAAVQAFSASPDFEHFAADFPAAASAAADAPGALIGWRFFVPESSDSGPDSDRRLLDKAMKLANDANFIANRELFYACWNGLRKGEVSLDEAREHMAKILADYDKFMASQRWKKRARYAMVIASPLLVAAGGAAAAPFLVGAGLAAAGVAAAKPLVEGAAAAGALYFGGRIEPSKSLPSVAPAAMFHDARRHFGWQAA